MAHPCRSEYCEKRRLDASVGMARVGSPRGRLEKVPRTPRAS